MLRDLGSSEAEAKNLLLLANLIIHIRKAISKLGSRKPKQPNALASPSPA